MFRLGSEKPNSKGCMVYKVGVDTLPQYFQTHLEAVYKQTGKSPVYVLVGESSVVEDLGNFMLHAARSTHPNSFLAEYVIPDKSGRKTIHLFAG